MNNILLVDDDPSTIQLLGSVLAKSGKLRFATNGVDALRLAREFPPDLMLLDAEMPGMNGFQVCEALKAEPALAHVPVIFITSHSEPAFEVAGLELGASDFIGKPINPALVLARVSTQLSAKAATDKLRRVATVDLATGLANRRHFDESLEREWRRARLADTALSLLLINIDHFKLFREHYGQRAADACLQSVAGAIDASCFRPADLAARYGEEQFAALLPQTDRRDAGLITHKILDAIEKLAITHANSPISRHATASIGIACYDEDSECWSPQAQVPRETGEKCSPMQLVQASEAALLIAQNAGGAQAKVLDIADLNAPHLARDILPPLRGDYDAARI